VRKLGYSFLALAGVVAIILLGRIYLKGPEEQPAARFPIQPPTAGSSALVPSEAKPDRVVRGVIPRSEAGPQSPAAGDKGKEQDRKAAAVTKPLAVPPSSQAAGAKAPDETGKKAVAVRGGDSIYTIAEKNYRVANTSIVDRILEQNPQISSPGRLLANQEISLPQITEESLLIGSSDGTYRVRLGTFLKAEYSTFLKGQPALRGREIEITPRKLPSGETWYRVTAGKFKSREEGLKVVQDLKEKGLSPYFAGFKKGR
jgi:phage tail protein X